MIYDGRLTAQTCGNHPDSHEWLRQTWTIVAYGRLIFHVNTLSEKTYNANTARKTCGFLQVRVSCILTVVGLDLPILSRTLARDEGLQAGPYLPLFTRLVQGSPVGSSVLSHSSKHQA